MTLNTSFATQKSPLLGCAPVSRVGNEHSHKDEGHCDKDNETALMLTQPSVAIMAFAKHKT